MKRSIAVLTLAAALIPGTPTLATDAADALESERPCPEYRPGRVLSGELWRAPCDVRPPQHLDLILYRGRLHGQTPAQRCDSYGGRYAQRLHKCNDVDY